MTEELNTILQKNIGINCEITSEAKDNIMLKVINICLKGFPAYI